MNNEHYETPQPSWLMRQMWKACGADEYLLRRSTYSDQIKYFCLGGIILATGVMAALAGGYAFYYIFEPKGDALEDVVHGPSVFIATFFGLIWGLIIFNIDRFIVTSTGKGDGTDRITSREFRSSIPRIIMGIIIALTISKPIEIRMFKSEIDAEIALIQKDYLSELNEKTDIEFDKKELTSIIIRDSLSKVIETQRIEIKSQREKLEIEAEGNSATGKPGRGPAWRDKKENLDKMEAEFLIFKETAELKVAKMDSNIAKLEAAREAEYAGNILRKNSKDGLLLRIQLAHSIAGPWISLFITLLFIVIELTPIFFKMMLIKGPYDFMQDNVNDISRAENGIQVIYDHYPEKSGQERHKTVHHFAKRMETEQIETIKAQESINLAIIENWKNEEINKVKEDPENRIGRTVRQPRGPVPHDEEQ